MSTDLDRIQNRIDAGDTEGARNALISMLRGNPQNAAAWMLLATLFSDPTRQADCYRQVLRINPGNQRAASQLRSLTGQPPEPPSQEKPSAEKEGIEEKKEALRCPQCGGAMEVRYIGEMQDKRAVCQYCKTQVDLPDSYQRIQQKDTHEQRLGGDITVEETIVETRRDGELSTQDHQSLLPKIEEMGYTSKTISTQKESRDQGFFGRLFSKKDDRTEKFTPLSPTEIIELAGGALPPEERRQCPNPSCGAVIPKDAARCSWCGESL